MGTWASASLVPSVFRTHRVAPNLGRGAATGFGAAAVLGARRSGARRVPPGLQRVGGPAGRGAADPGGRSLPTRAAPAVGVGRGRVVWLAGSRTFYLHRALSRTGGVLRLVLASRAADGRRAQSQRRPTAANGETNARSHVARPSAPPPGPGAPPRNRYAQLVAGPPEVTGGVVLAVLAAATVFDVRSRRVLAWLTGDGIAAGVLLAAWAGLRARRRPGGHRRRGVVVLPFDWRG